MNLAVALLAGGDSRRMGEDKAFLEDGGRPLWEIQAEKLETLGAEKQLLCIRADQSMERAGWTRVEDPPERSGPMSALTRALETSEKRAVLLLAVDLPRLPLSFLQSLAPEDGEAGIGLIPRVGGRLQPVAALWPAEALGEARAALDEDRLSLTRLAKKGITMGWMKVLEVTDQKVAAGFANLNTPEEATAVLSIRSTPLLVERWTGGIATRETDHVAREEPLQIRVEGENVAVVMRTPGHDVELATGFLLSEGVIRTKADLFEISECPTAQEGDSGGQTLDVLLGKSAHLDLEQLSRHVFAASSCGICGKATIEAVLQRIEPIAPAPPVEAALLQALPDRLAQSQRVFQRTGGLHACALFERDGSLLQVREDVGRHNALDKLLGWAVENDRLPLSDTVLLLSGRVSLEMMQKALVGGVPAVAAISAPTSLAVEFAAESGQTLVGFLRGDRMNVYAGQVGAGK